jgi:hypothetical protein
LHGLVRLKKKEIVWTTRDWEGREVTLDRQTLKDHILRYHYEAAFIVDAIKASLSEPHIVIENKKQRSENAIYNLACGEHPWTLVAIKHGWLKRRQISTIYGIEKGCYPKGRTLWPKK